MSALVGLLSALAPRLFNVVDSVVESKSDADRLKAELAKMLADQNGELARASAQVVSAELAGESWLQRNWRPMLMVFFSVLVGAYWFGWTPPNLSEARVEDLFELVKIGVGGYIGGRSVEKSLKIIAPVLGGKG
jgi:hypothetical protein